MKGLFIFSQEVKKDSVKENSLYEFIPYNYGPCSFEIYEDLRFLTHLGLLFPKFIEGQNWKYYSLSKKGKLLDKQIKIDIKAFKFLKEIKDFIIETPFSLLLKAIYKEYPKFAVNSIFKY